MIPILMPQVGENLPTGTVLEWLCEEGQPVTRGEVLLTVESEKAVFEVQAEADGVLAKIMVQPGEEGAVLEPVGYLARTDGDVSGAGRASPRSTAGSAVPDDRAQDQDQDQTGASGPAATGALPEPAPSPSGALATSPAIASGAPVARRPTASPAARRRARELGLDLARLTGSGSGGRIIVRDVDAAAVALDHSPSVDEVVPFSRLRRHIAARTSLSSRTIPHLYLFADIDMSAALAHLDLAASGPEPRPVVTDLLISALARALRQFPRLNGHVEGESLILKGAVNVGVATATCDGMLLPVVAGAGRKSLREIAAIRRKNAAAVRRGIVHLGARATVTLADLGDRDIYRVLPLINPPECAVLGAGAVQERVVSRHRTPTVRDVMGLSLGCDHRVVDADYGARFLECLKALLEQPGTPPSTVPGSP